MREGVFDLFRGTHSAVGGAARHRIQVHRNAYARPSTVYEKLRARAWRARHERA